MGLKSIEMIKTVTLIVLIGLSLVLTLLIWNTAPYDTIGKQTTVDISIAESPEKKGFDSIIKPYKVLFNFEEGLTGSTDSEKVDYIVDHLQDWRITNPELVETSADKEVITKLIQRPNQFVLYFPDDVPLPVYENILNIENANMPETSFNVIIVEWDIAHTMLEIHFLSDFNGMHYTSTTPIVDLQSFTREIVSVGQSYDTYVEVSSTDSQSITVPVTEVELLQNTYFPSERDEINPTRFRSALFSDPNAVRRSQVGSRREDFQDNHALMSVDTERKQLEFVHPVVESKQLAIPSELLEDTIDFVNEHGGWTDEYRFSRMNFRTRYVNFKLYVRGIPVLGGNTSTEIEQIWGEDAIYQYKRPYYTLGDTLPSETETVILPSGVEVTKALKESPEVEFDKIDEIIPAYYMNQDIDLNIFVLEPAWFYLQRGKWIRFSSDQLGGGEIGLE